MENSKEERGQQNVWYAIQTFHCMEERLGEYLAANELAYYIPKRYEVRTTSGGGAYRELGSAVHNLLFLEKTFEDDTLSGLMEVSPVPFFILCNTDTRGPCEIKASVIETLRAICTPELEDTIYIDFLEVEQHSGSHVRVKQGKLKGLEGKLMRYKNRYYVAVVVATLGVMVHIPKWFCERVD